ncbi:MAG: UDP-N-acetylmuramoyl-L-alanine--D-glutamate ligase [Firmicutes bacterium]|nr:UDP-N-acetylmuramoyl-L-alanine--D-glutamate ligase [Bacillota bacterium]
MAPRVALLGLGLENLALARYLLAQGYEVVICDRRDEVELGERLQELRRAGVILRLGPDYLRNLEEFSILYRSPGLPLFHPALEAARAAGCRITSAIRLFFALCTVPIIGVTGTKGKGTTASLIFQILQQDRAEKGGRVWLGGNIGVAPFSFFEEIGPQDLVVLELSSFQLEDLDRSPAVGVVTNITPEHLAPGDPNNPNYHRSFADYVAAKANILVHQGPEDVAVLNADDPRVQLLAPRTPGRKLWFGRPKEEDGCYVGDRGQGRWIYLRRKGEEISLCPVSAVRLRGEHNLQNICAAAAAATAVGAGPDAVYEAVTAFEGLEHRLEFVREVEGVKYFDDSFATTPEASAVAIRAFSEPLVVIAGGADKGADYHPFAEAVVEGNVRAVILIGATAEKIRRTIEECSREKGRPPVSLVEGPSTMEGIVDLARRLARPGDVVRLSTASASFGLFRNYKERGDLFKQAVRAL